LKLTPRFGVLSLLALAASTLLTGCTLTTTASPGTATGAALQGKVHGGSQPAGISELNNSGTPISPSTGYIASSLLGAGDIAVDLSGNVWVPITTGTGDASGVGVVEFVGAGSPTITPLATAVATSKLGARP
jgi:hypothetical protein